METVLTTKEIMEMLGVSRVSVQNWRRQGFITPTYFVNKSPRYSLADVEELIKRKKLQEVNHGK